jgi:hypothetical protein
MSKCTLVKRKTVTETDQGRVKRGEKDIKKVRRRSRWEAEHTAYKRIPRKNHLIQKTTGERDEL